MVAAGAPAILVPDSKTRRRQANRVSLKRRLQEGASEFFQAYGHIIAACSGGGCGGAPVAKLVSARKGYSTLPWRPVRFLFPCLAAWDNLVRIRGADPQSSLATM